MCSTGMKDGQKIVFHGEGDQEPELEAGDVIIVLDQKDHSVFQRRGHDLIMKMKIQLSEALCGFKKTIKTLDDRVLVITSKSGSALPPPAAQPGLTPKGQGGLHKPACRGFLEVEGHR